MMNIGDAITGKGTFCKTAGSMSIPHWMDNVSAYKQI
jgi:hypothetical protein